jgi:3D (Asp-Asp-Asp) domain-containing protein
MGPLRMRLPAPPRRHAWPAVCSAVLPAALLLAAILLPGAAAGANFVRIHVDGRTLVVDPRAADSVREALVQARVVLGEDDEVAPPIDGPLPSDGTIRVSRVTFEEGTVEKKVPYRTIVREATRENRPYHPSITTAGRNGLARVTYRARLVDGREVSRVTVREEVVREPVHQIVTSRNPRQLASRGAYAGARTLRVLSSAYDPGPGSCGKWSNGTTTNGTRAGYGVVAVDPRLIPLGAKLFIPGYGYAIAADVGRAIKGVRIDLGFNSRQGALQWGKKWVTVTILE